MKILVLFGSQSDEYIYGPLVNGLKQEKFEVDFQVLSAHRDPDKLEIKLKETNADFIVAGAGLAAHLPGVVASKISKPVLGISVPAQFGGLDALCSIQQMPYGVPVLSIAPSYTSQSLNLIKQYSRWSEKEKNRMINVLIDKKVFDYEYIQSEYKRLKNLSFELNFELNLIHDFEDTAPTINFVHDEKCIIDDVYEGENPIIQIPLIDKTQRSAPTTAILIFQWAEKGGAWCGVNNSRNALTFYNKFYS